VYGWVIVCGADSNCDPLYVSASKPFRGVIVGPLGVTLVSVRADGDLSSMDSTVPPSSTTVEESDGSNHRTRPGKLAGVHGPNLYESTSIDISVAPSPDKRDLRPSSTRASARDVNRDLLVVRERGG